jgi:hypothetical protein
MIADAPMQRKAISDKGDGAAGTVSPSAARASLATLPAPMCKRAASVIGIVGVCALPRAAGAEPLRLRADATAEARAPAGLVVLQGEDKVTPWFQAEGLVWTGARSTYTVNDDPTADVLVLNFRLREPHGLAEMRGGRFVVATGAVRPVAIDGASAIGRAPWGSTVEAFGGQPVVPRFGARPYDWLAGGRVAQTVLSRATVGLSYVQRRAHGEIADDEVGADLAAVPLPWLDLAARSAYDLVSPGIADALASAAVRFGGAWRVEGFASQRSPSRLLPATSLFSVLGDFPSQQVGGTLKWRAAPRLDLLATGAGQAVGGQYGGNATVRALLRLDDEGAGNMGLEMRRQDVSTAQWTGVRTIANHPLPWDLRVSSELEIVVPDKPNGRGIAWPWGLLALAWRPHDTGWEVAAATEAASTPEHSYEVNALVRVARTMELR